MPIYYLNTRPETVASIIQTGKLPKELPSHAKIDCLLCVKNTADSFTQTPYPLHQMFLLELDFPEHTDKSDEFLILESLDPAIIKKIIVYSETGRKLLTNLCKSQCPKPIEINPALYSAPISTPIPQPPKRSLSDFFKENPSSKTEPHSKKSKPNLSPINTTSTTQNSAKPQNPLLSRLGTYEEHIQFMQMAFREAQKSILVTSFSINRETLQQAGLYELIPLAASRGVRIYFYYNDQKFIDPQVLTFLKQHNVSCAESYTHSKILAVDKRIAAAGSFNWLSSINSHYKPSEEGSIFVQDKEICELLIEEFWKYIKYYRNEQYGNIRQLNHFERNPNNMSSLVCELDDKTELTYLPTLEEHSGFLEECFEQAQKRIIICSPFISESQGYKEEINYPLLKKTILRGIDIYFVCANDSPALKDFGLFLDKLHSSKIHLIPVDQIHLKTIIVDEDLIAEGSFNWLSATRDRESDFHNHEQTLVVEGKQALPLIEHFFKSRVGEAVQSHIHKNTNSPATPSFMRNSKTN